MISFLLLTISNFIILKINTVLNVILCCIFQFLLDSSLISGLTLNNKFFVCFDCCVIDCCIYMFGVRLVVSSVSTGLYVCECISWCPNMVDVLSNVCVFVIEWYEVWKYLLYYVGGVCSCSAPLLLGMGMVGLMVGIVGYIKPVAARTRSKRS